jgi:hypothetical protein
MSFDFDDWIEESLSTEGDSLLNVLNITIEEDSIEWICTNNISIFLDTQDGEKIWEDERHGQKQYKDI